MEPWIALIGYTLEAAAYAYEKVLARQSPVLPREQYDDLLQALRLVHVGEIACPDLAARSLEVSMYRFCDDPEVNAGLMYHELAPAAYPRTDSDYWNLLASPLRKLVADRGHLSDAERAWLLGLGLTGEQLGWSCAAADALAGDLANSTKFAHVLRQELGKATSIETAITSALNAVSGH